MRKPHRPGIVRQIAGLICIHSSIEIMRWGNALLAEPPIVADGLGLDEDDAPEPIDDGVIPQDPLTPDAFAMLERRDTIPSTAVVTPPLAGSIADRMRKVGRDGR